MRVSFKNNFLFAAGWCGFREVEKVLFDGDPWEFLDELIEVDGSELDFIQAFLSVFATDDHSDFIIFVFQQLQSPTFLNPIDSAVQVLDFVICPIEKLVTWEYLEAYR